MKTLMKIKMLSLGVLLLGLLLPLMAGASETNGTISDSSKYAWGEEIGWINFKPQKGNILVTDAGLTGYAWSANYGWINLSPSTSGVKNDGEGNLSGFAWNENLGWIDFAGVKIDKHGRFSGTAGATSSDFGRIAFTCNNCDVRTDWRPESERDDDDNDNDNDNDDDNDDDDNNDDDSSTGGWRWSGGTGINEIDTDGDGIPDYLDDDVDGDGIPNSEDPDYQADRPAQLFDISLEIDNPKLSMKEKLAARVIFTSFGTEATPVQLTFIILNGNGEELYREYETEVVETEAVVTKIFKDLSLAPGKYTLLLKTLYNENVEDEFHADFEVMDGFSWLWLLLLLVIILIIFALCKKRDEEENKKQK